MADWFVGPVMERIINAFSDYLQGQFRFQTGMKEYLERLRENHPKVQAVVSASSTQSLISAQNPALKDWIWLLRDSIDEADDLLDELEYMKLKKQLIKNKKRRQVRFAISFLKRAGQRALKIDPYLKRLMEVVQKLDKVSAEVGTFLHLAENAKQEHQKQEIEFYKTRETGSLPKNDLIGRGEDMEFVMQWLRKPSNEDPAHITLYKNISLLSIVGHGGMGKTALLQHVYEDLKEEFDLKMWVCVSNYFEVKKVIADMLECLKMKKPDVESLDALQRSLKSEVMDKKFLLVLDDVWEEEQESDESKWENVFSPLAYGTLGSKILVTTRMDSVATVIAKVIKKKKKTLRLKGLGDDESLQLLNTHAFADVENFEDHKQLRSIARDIVKTLSGSPLAIKVIGGVLSSSLNVSHWIKVLNSDFGSASLGQSNVMHILRLSYTFLPRPLQNCFTFCSIFPQDHNFIRDDLVKMWISLGFIQTPSSSGETTEDIGGKCFDILVKKSFFVNFEPYYRMHDLLHELAQTISAQECFRVVGDKGLPSKIPKTIRYLSVETSNIEVLRRIAEFKNLHSLFLRYRGDDQDFIQILTEIFKSLKSIRLLFINHTNLKMIPEEIVNLIHLRYLNISYTNITLVPRTLNYLHHLQFIIYKNLKWRIRCNPKQLQKAFSEMPGIGMLKSLRELDWFSVKNEKGFKIGELEHLNELCRLRISSLENVKDSKEARIAKLCEKRNLTDLWLDWGDESKTLRNIVDTVLDEKVLENLQPHNKLEHLRIYAYMGAKSATWMNDANYFSNLKFIELSSCLEWETLPPFEQLPFLKTLFLDNMPKAKRFYDKFHGNGKACVFPSLERLDITKLEALENWYDAVEGVSPFPCLHILRLKDCPKLQELPSRPLNLWNLEIDNVGWKAFNWLPGIDDSCRYISIKNCSNFNYIRKQENSETFKKVINKVIIKDLSVLLMEPLRGIASFEELSIEENDDLVSFTFEVEQWFLKFSLSLLELNFRRLKSLQSLPSSLPRLSLLQVLCVHEAPQLQQLLSIPASLERLDLGKLESLQCLPSLSAIISLKYLTLESIPHLKSLPNLPPSLYELRLNDLNQLDCLPSCFPTLSSLQTLSIIKVPQLRELPGLPPSLLSLFLEDLNQLNCPPSFLSTLSSLDKLAIINLYQVRELVDLPPALSKLQLEDLDRLDCLPSSLASLSCLRVLWIINVPQLRDLPDLPPSLKHLVIEDCHPELMERYKKYSGSDWHKIAHIPVVEIYPR